MASVVWIGHWPIRNEYLVGNGNRIVPCMFAILIETNSRASLSVVGMHSSNNESITIGINLSDMVYNDDNGISMESAVW